MIAKKEELKWKWIKLSGKHLTRGLDRTSS